MPKVDPLTYIFLAFLRVLRSQGYIELHTVILPHKVMDAYQAVLNLTVDSLPPFCRDAIVDAMKLHMQIAPASRRFMVNTDAQLGAEVLMRLEWEAHRMQLAYDNWKQNCIPAFHMQSDFSLQLVSVHVN